MFGYSNGELLGRHVSVLNAATERQPRETTDEFIRVLRAKGMWRGEVLNIKKDGTPFWTHANISTFEHPEYGTVWVTVRTDITERKRVEEALRASEQRFRLVADAAPAMIWMSGVDKLCTWFNKPWLAFTGRTMEQEIGDGWSENLHAADRDQCLNTYTTAFDARQPFSMEYRLRRHDGEYRWLLDNGVPHFGPSGEFSGYVGSCVDITERKQAEESVALAYRQLKFAMSAGRMGAWTWDPQTDAITTSEGYPDICGVSAFEGREHAMSLLHPDDRSRHADIVEQALKYGTPYQSVVRLVRPDNGQVVWLDFRGVPVTDGEGRVTALSGIAIDVTERKRAEEALRASQEWLQAILNTATDAIITIDQRGIIKSVNPAAEQMFGYTAAEMIGQNVKMLMPSPYREEHNAFLANFLRTGERRIIGIGREVQACRKDGTVFPVDLAVSVVEPGKLFTGMVRDISRRKQLEHEVLEIATLEQRRIGAELHDDIGQHVSGLTMLAEALAQHLAEDASPRQNSAAQLAAGLGRLRQQARNLARGLLAVDVYSMGLKAALEELAERVHEQAGVSCRFHCPDAIGLQDTTTAMHLFRIAQEAVNNALRHSKAQHIDVSLVSLDSALVLSIRDDGIGIADTPEETKGIGIRLMRNRAGLIGGRLIISANEGGGTLVTCIVPWGGKHAQD
jgi:PAS domain S-box-containing protein